MLTMLWVGIFCTDVCIKGFPNVPRGNLGITDQARMWTHPTANRTHPTLEPPFFTPHQFSACILGDSLRRSVQRRASVAIQTAPLPGTEARPSRPRRTHELRAHRHAAPIHQDAGSFQNLPLFFNRIEQGTGYNLPMSGK